MDEAYANPDFGTSLTVKLSKADGARRAADGTMKAWLAALDRWARRMGDDGYEIRPEPLDGPGTMVWNAVKK